MLREGPGPDTRKKQIYNTPTVGRTTLRQRHYAERHNPKQHKSECDIMPNDITPNAT